MKKKIIVFGAVALLLLINCMPASAFVNTLQKDVPEDKEEEKDKPSGQELPDLIPIKFEGANIRGRPYLSCIVQNIGNKTVKDDICAKVTIKRGFSTIEENIGCIFRGGGIKPGEKIEVLADYESSLIGLVRCVVEVDPDNIIVESNEDNNKMITIVFLMLNLGAFVIIGVSAN